MGTTDKLARLNETKALLKQRLVEKGITEAASDDNFYRLAGAVGMISQMKSITVTGDGTNKIVVPFSIYRFFICALKRVSESIISGLYNNSDINIVFINSVLVVMDGTFTVTVSESETTISAGLINKFADGIEYIIYYW